MRLFYLLIFTSLTYLNSNAQTIQISGQCVANPIILTREPVDYNGKPVYFGLGTVDGNDNIDIYIFWEDNVWNVTYSGQPYYQNSCQTELPPSTGSTSCSWTPVDPSGCAGSAPLTIAGSGALPVKLSGFTASGNNKMVQLDWKTSFESNNKGFEIQRSKNGIDWVQIGFVEKLLSSATEENYQYIDGSPFSEKNYYMLNQVDMDGRKSPSPIVQVNFSTDNYYTVGNNPGNGIYQLDIRAAEKVEISVLDLAGRKLISKIAPKGKSQLDLSSFAKGLYLLQLKKDNKIVTEKLIKK